MKNKPLCSLSYVMAAKNKLSYLRVSLKRLMANLKADEEIVIGDGGSTDGSAEFLKDLYRQGKIQLISRPDSGEAHALNRAIFAARGQLIKFVTDDDVYNFPAIKECKDYMLEHPQVDAMGGNTCSITFSHARKYVKLSRSQEIWFSAWSKGYINSCFFSGQTLMIRKDSMARFGLWDNTYKIVDIEYIPRLCTQGAKMAFNSSIMVISIVNQRSVTNVFSPRLQIDTDRVARTYGFTNLLDKRFPQRYLNLLIDLRIKIRMPDFPLNLRDYDRRLPYEVKIKGGLEKANNISSAFRQCDLILRKYNQSHKGRIIAPQFSN